MKIGQKFYCHAANSHDDIEEWEVVSATMRDRDVYTSERLVDYELKNGGDSIYVSSVNDLIGRRSNNTGNRLFFCTREEVVERNRRAREEANDLLEHEFEYLKKKLGK